MGIHEDITTQLSAAGISTNQGTPPDRFPVEYVSGAITAFTDITDLLTLPMDFEDTAIELTNGQTLSIYGDTTEFTLVMVLDDGADKWGYSCKYTNLDDYNAGKGFLVPAAELRV